MPKAPPDVPSADPLPPLKDTDRLTTITKVYHEHRGDQPKEFSVIFTELLGSTEESYSRRYSVGEDWKEVDLGWLAPENVRVIAIENLEGRNLLVNPTDEEAKAISDKVLEASYNSDSNNCDTIPARGGLVKRPGGTAPLMLRCRSGVASIRTTVYPK